jgi:nucleoside 2-deoxyribosyltransferase
MATNEHSGMAAHDEMRTFDSGAVRDGGKKPALELISPHALHRLGEWLRFACEDRQPKPYPRRNWEKGLSFSSTVASIERHIQKFKLGDTSEDHIAAILFGGMALAHYEEEIKAGRLPQSLDDMPHYLQRWSPQTQVGQGLTRCPICGHTEGHRPDCPAVLVERTLEPKVSAGQVFAQTAYDIVHGVKPFTVYLCGPITGKEVDYKWRDDATAHFAQFGIKTLNPLRGKHREDVGNMGLSYKGQLAAPEIAERDRMDIQEADAVLAVFPYDPPRQSVGSLMEMGAAAIGFGKPVVLCTQVHVLNQHLFCRNFCTVEPMFDLAMTRIVAIAAAKKRD